MTRPSKNSLVLDGNEIKYRLHAHRTHSKTPVHVDWLRFTVARRNAPAPAAEVLFPAPLSQGWQPDVRAWRLKQLIAELLTEDQQAAMQSHALAEEVAQALGQDYAVDLDIRKGHDFYKSRWPIVRHGQECGWVGFGASSDSPKQKSQARTIHVNLFGAACTFADLGWNHRLARVVEDNEGDITRCDLALDFFDGLAGGMEGVKADYSAGLCNSSGRKLKCNMVGDWSGSEGRGRSFYFGSKEAGKQTNVYEKGDQLYGIEAGSNWTRIELRYGNKLRVLPVEMLRRPADFFAGASDWHALKLAEASHIAEPEKVATTPRLAMETIDAEVTRNVRWAQRTASATIAACFQYMGDGFLDLCASAKLPGRLQKFSKSELCAAFERLTQSTAGGVGRAPAYAV